MRIVLSIAAVILAIASSARAQQDMSSSPAAMPEVVVQRFVDAANARDANAMAALVAPDAVFARFPGGQVIAQSRDSIQAHYSRRLQSLPPDFRITVEPRIVEGQIVIDQEHFMGMPPERSQATWMYLVRDGLIRRAWALEGAPDRAEPSASGDRAVPEGTTPVPVHEEPRHRLAYENALVRVLDVRVGPGDTTLYHVHADHMFSVVIAAARTWEQFQSRPASPPSADLSAGQVLDNSAATLPYTHRVGNVDTVGFHYVVGVLRAPSGIASPALVPTTGLTLERETQGGRVYRARLAPGEATPAHRHAQPGLTVQVGIGSLRLEGTAPQAAHPDPGSGAWWWRAAGTQHVVRNSGATVVEVVEIDWQ